MSAAPDPAGTSTQAPRSPTASLASVSTDGRWPWAGLAGKPALDPGLQNNPPVRGHAPSSWLSTPPWAQPGGAATRPLKGSPATPPRRKRWIPRSSCSRGGSRVDSTSSWAAQRRLQPRDPEDAPPCSPRAGGSRRRHLPPPPPAPGSGVGGRGPLRSLRIPHPTHAARPGPAPPPPRPRRPRAPPALLPAGRTGGGRAAPVPSPLAARLHGVAGSRGRLQGLPSRSLLPARLRDLAEDNCSK